MGVGEGECGAMSSLLLTAAERQRFADWLDREADAGQAIAGQFEKLNPAVAEALLKRERAEVAAAKIIAAKLRSIQDG